MRVRSFIGAGAAAVALLGVAGCGGSGDPVAWTDQVCASVLKFTEAAKTQPQINPSDPAAAVKSVSAYLGTAADALQGSIDGLNAVGKSPVTGGDEVVTKLKSALGQFQSGFKQAKTQVDAIDTANKAALSTALPAALTPLKDLGSVADPTTDLKSNAELDKAANEAPNCQKVRSAGS